MEPQSLGLLSSYELCSSCSSLQFGQREWMYNVASEDAIKCLGCTALSEAIRPFLLRDEKSSQNPVFAFGCRNDTNGLYAISVVGIEGHSRLEQAGETVAIVLTSTPGALNPWGMKHITFSEFAEAYDSGSDIVQFAQTAIVDLGDTTLSPQTVQLAKMWLDACCEHYSFHCSISDAEVSTLPHRVLGFDQEEYGLIRLHEFDCEQERPKARYMCLSYCWGGADFIRLTKGNQQELKDGVPLESLPRLFRDFIHLARTFRIFYVWIDSLCIIQDDLDDWAIEAARMAEIYSQSFLTVCATGSRSPFEGLEKPRPNEDVICHQIRRRVIRALPTLHSPSFPLFNRAWCYQERLLSPRTLHFGPEGVFWECATGVLSEYGHEQRYTTYGGLNRRRFCDASESFSFSDKGHQWRSIVQHYTNLALTKPTDRLPGIMGLSVAMQSSPVNVLGDYFSGLWENSLPIDLLWERLPQATPLAHQSSPGSTLAPSWSWAYINGPVVYPEAVQLSFGSRMVKYCEVLPVWRGDPAKIWMRCQMVSGGVVNHAVVEGVEEGLPRWRPEETGSESGLYRLPVVVDDFVRLNKVRDPVFLVRVAQCVATDFFLVVRRVAVGEHVYERVGIVQASSELEWIVEESQWEDVDWNGIVLV